MRGGLLRRCDCILQAGVALSIATPSVLAGVAGSISPGKTDYRNGGMQFIGDVQIPPGTAPNGSNRGLYSDAIDASAGYALFGSIAGNLTKVQLGAGMAAPKVVGITSSL